MTKRDLKMKEASPGSDWPKTANRYVAYIDIMGFKDMVLRESHSEIHEMMLKIGQYIKDSEEVQWNKATSKLIKTTYYSDSIIIYSKDDSFYSLDSFICTVAAFTHALLAESIPHKGAVAFGLMTLDTDNSIFFGQPLIDAYILQEELDLVIIPLEVPTVYWKKKPVTGGLYGALRLQRIYRK
jgi:hypothetical protein